MALFFLLLAQGAFAQESVGLKTLSVEVFVLKNSDWTEARISQHFKRVNEIYQQCGIAIEPGAVHFIEGGESSVIVEERDDLKMASRNSDLTARIYFVSHLSSKKGESRVAYSYSPVHFSREWGFDQTQAHALNNTAWISNDADGRYKDEAEASYDIVAHELGHILADCIHGEHYDPDAEDADPSLRVMRERSGLNFKSCGVPIDSGVRHLMASTVADLNDHLEPFQCQKMRQNSLLH